MFIVAVVFSLVMAAAGGFKVVGAKPLADQFAEFGLPKFMLYLVGILELSAAVGVHVTPLRFFAAGGVVLLMLGAIANHLKARHPLKQVLPAVIALGLAVALCVGSWNNVF